MAWTDKLSPSQGCSTVVGLQNSPLGWGRVGERSVSHLRRWSSRSRRSSPSEMAFWISSNHLGQRRPASRGGPRPLVAGEQGRSAPRLAVVRPRGRSDAGGPRREWGKPAGAAGGQQAVGVRRAAGCQRRRPRALEEAGVCGACVWLCVCGVCVVCGCVCAWRVCVRVIGQRIRAVWACVFPECRRHALGKEFLFNYFLFVLYFLNKK